MFKQYFVLVLQILFDVMSMAIIVRSLMSFTNIPRSHPIYKILTEITDPILNVFSKIIPKTGMIDFTPLIAIITLDLIKTILFTLLNALGS